MEGSSFNGFWPFVVFRVIITFITTLDCPPWGSSCSSGFNSTTSPSQTSFVSLILNPMALRKFSIKISVFLTSDENTSDPTIGQNGTFGPSSYDKAKAMAVFPVPGGPANSKALPAIFFILIKSTTTPAAFKSYNFSRYLPLLPNSVLPCLVKLLQRTHPISIQAL